MSFGAWWGKTAILTESPYKAELEERQRRKKPKTQNKKTQKKPNKKLKSHPRKKWWIWEWHWGYWILILSGFVFSIYWRMDHSCQLCGRWAHCPCAGVEDDDDEAVHICPNCGDSDWFNVPHNHTPSCPIDEGKMGQNTVLKKKIFS